MHDINQLTFPDLTLSTAFLLRDNSYKHKFPSLMLLGNLCQSVLNTVQSLNTILKQDKNAVTLILLLEIIKYI
jgi:hypothetical protein